MSRQSFLLIFFLFVTACLPSENKKISADTARIIKGEIGGQTYYVPEVYSAVPNVGVSDNGLYVRAMYPEFAPILERPNDLWKKEEWYKNISILADHNSGRKFAQASEASDISTKVSIETEKAFQIVGNEYGLIHQTQTVDGIHDLDDVWIEKRNGHVVSHITCGEKILRTDTPQCKHRTNWNNFFLKIRYDKRFLPEWKKIEQDSLALLDSFKSEKAAREYLGQRLSEVKPKKEGTQP